MKQLLRMVGILILFAGNALSQIREIEIQKPPFLRTTLTVPAGTHVLMCLTSPLHTTSARTGSGVYLETSGPVIQFLKCVTMVRAIA